MVYLFSLSVDYVLSTVIMFNGLNQILNHFVVFNIHITVKVSQYLLGSPAHKVIQKCTDNIFTSPLLLRYDSFKPSFIKTD